MTTVRLPPPRRYHGPVHLVVAGVFGGVAAACWLLAADERLHARARVPWRRLAAVALGGEAVAQYAIWPFRSAVWPVAARFATFAGIEVLVLAGLCTATWRRYASVRKVTVPADAMTAVEVGWVFCALRAGLSLGLAAALRG